MAKTLLLVALGGGLGSALRFAISYYFKDVLQMKWPVITLIINILGSLLIGILLAYYTKQAHWSKELLVAGFCGWFTTFSAFSYENVYLLQQGQIIQALMYMLFSCVLGIACCALGWYLFQA